MSSTILFPTDYSEASHAALPFATSLARDWGATLLVVHVSEKENYPVGEVFDEEAPPPAEEMAKLEMVKPIDEAVHCKHKVLFADPSSETAHPAKEIVKCADEEGVDAIVMGSHGRTGLSHLLMGSIADAVLRDAPCPVVTVKQPKK